MNSKKEMFPTTVQQETIKLLDPLVTFIARSELYSKEALILTKEQLVKGRPNTTDETDLAFLEASITYLNALITAYD